MANIDQAKYENTILYLCNALGGSIQGKKKLAKLLYYVDFDRYEFKESMKSITGDTYKSWKMGPVPTKYMRVVEKLIKEGKLTKTSVQQSPEHSHPTEVFTSKSQPDKTKLDEDDLKIIDHVVRKYGGLNGKQLEDLTHNEAPYVATEPDQEIAYELAFYRETDFSDVMANA